MKVKKNKKKTCFTNALLVFCKSFLILPQFLATVGEDLEFFVNITPRNIFGNFARYNNSELGRFKAVACTVGATSVTKLQNDNHLKKTKQNQTLKAPK